jgi:hypothetical protein
VHAEAPRERFDDLVELVPGVAVGMQEEEIRAAAPGADMDPAR